MEVPKKETVRYNPSSTAIHRQLPRIRTRTNPTVVRIHFAAKTVLRPPFHPSRRIITRYNRVRNGSAEATRADRNFSILYEITIFSLGRNVKIDSPVVRAIQKQLHKSPPCADASLELFFSLCNLSKRNASTLRETMG